MYHDEGAFELTEAIEPRPIHKHQLFLNRRTGLYRRQTGRPVMARELGIEPIKRKYKSINLRFCTTIVVRERNPKPPRAWKNQYIIHRPIFRQLHFPSSSATTTDSTTANKVREMQMYEKPFSYDAFEDGEPTKGGTCPSCAQWRLLSRNNRRLLLSNPNR